MKAKTFNLIKNGKVIAKINNPFPKLLTWLYANGYKIK
jgi:hypothetical protein